MLTRRTLLASTAAFALLPQAARAEAPEGFFAAERPLPEMEMGSKDAKVVITEYASMTCPHCKTFHESTLPKLKEQYVDTGKVRYQLREFAFDPLSAAAFMLARCAPNDGYFPMVDILFESQTEWSRSQNPANALFEKAKLAGFTRPEFDKCLSDQALLDNVNAVRREGEKFGVRGTPTVFVNGEKVESSFDAISKAVEAQLAS